MQERKHLPDHEIQGHTPASDSSHPSISFIQTLRAPFSEESKKRRVFEKKQAEAFLANLQGNPQAIEEIYEGFVNIIANEKNLKEYVLLHEKRHSYDKAVQAIHNINSKPKDLKTLIEFWISPRKFVLRRMKVELKLQTLK